MILNRSGSTGVLVGSTNALENALFKRLLLYRILLSPHTVFRLVPLPRFSLFSPTMAIKSRL